LKEKGGCETLRDIEKVIQFVLLVTTKSLITLYHPDRNHFLDASISNRLR